MKIENTKKSGKVFGDVNQGGVFKTCLSNNECYLKTTEITTPSGKLNCTNLLTGYMGFVHYDTEVFVVEAKVVVS